MKLFEGKLRLRNAATLGNLMNIADIGRADALCP